MGKGFVFLRVLSGLVLIAVLAGIGFFAYNAGMARGATLSAVAAGSTAALPWVYMHPAPFFGGGGLLGFLAVLFLIFLAFGALRMLLWGPMMARRFMHGMGNGGNGDWRERGVPPFFAEWHRRAHEQPAEEKKEG